MNLRLRAPDLLALAACALLAFLALYNPIFHLPDQVTTDIVPVVTDYFHYHWNYWWIRHALTTGLPVYETNYVFAPFTSSLALHPLTPLFYPIWAAVEPIGGTAVAMTVVFFAGYTLTGYSVYLLLRDEGVSPGWAMIGAALVEWMSIMTTSARWTLINLIAWFWLPVILLTWKRLTRAVGSRAWLWAGVLGLVFWGMILTDLQYPLFVLPLLVPYALYRMIANHPPTQRMRALVRTVIYGAVALIIGVILACVLGPLDEAIRFDRSGLSPTPADRAVSIEFPTCYVWHCEHGVSVGLIPTVLTGIALWLWLRTKSRKPQKRDSATRWLWLIMIPVPLLLSVGAEIEIGGVSIPMPYALLHSVFGGLVRYPERFLPVFLIPALLFALSVLDERLRGKRLNRWLIPVVFLLVTVDTRVLDPMPVQPLPKRYAFYEQIAAEPYDYVIVEIPTGGASGEGIVGDARYAELEYYGMIHGKRMVNGHISRVPTYNYFYMNTDDPMMAWLGQRRFIEAETVERLMNIRIPEWRIGYFIIHRDLIAPDQAAINEIIAFFNRYPYLFCWYATEGDMVVYRTVWHPDGCYATSPPQIAPFTYEIDMGSDADIPYLGEGWYYQESLFDTTIRWAGAADTASVNTFLLSGDYTLTLTAQAFDQPRDVTLWVNGEPSGEMVTVSPDALADYTFTLTVPTNEINAGERVTLALTFDDRLTPREVGMGEDDRTLAVMVDKLILSAR